jgi:glycosyltransferase involved in cell wall biosynthesis
MSENSLPLVTVIIPVYNGTNYLREAIESVLSQTYANYELLVVDDGSTDETWAVIESYGSRLRGIHKDNGGVASALNCGIRNARGEYIAWLSHDDLFLPEKLEHQISFLNKFNEYRACYTDYYIIDTTGNPVREVETPWYPREKAIRGLFGNMYINGSTMLIERTCFDQVGFFSEELKYTQDAEMWLRLIRQFDIGRLPEKLIKQRTHPAQWSVSLKPAHREETKNLYERIFREWGIAVIFPELSNSLNDPKTVARVHTWFGDTSAFHRGFFDLADIQYRKSKDVWPSWKNSATIKLVLGSRAFFFPKRVYHYLMWRLFRVGFPSIRFH